MGKNEAIIVIPGIMGSNLKNSESNRLVWMTHKGVFELAELIYLLNGELNCNSLGESVKPIEPVEGEEEYGTNERYKALITRLKDKFGDVYKVVFFAYDWRLNNDLNSLKLKEEIDKFDKVIIIAHSMGGLIVARYIISYGKSRLKNVVTLGTPYLGSIDAFQYLCTGKPKSLPKNAVEAIKEFSAGLISKDVKNLLLNYPSIYQLIPNSEYTESHPWLILAKEKQGHWYDYFWEPRNDKFEDIEETKRFLVESFNKGLVEAAEKFYEALKDLLFFIKDMEYSLIAGSGIPTVNFIKVINCNTSNGKLNAIDVEYSNEGDGVVQVFSGVGGDAFNKKVIKIYGESHDGLVSDDVILRLVESIIKGEDISAYRYGRDENFKRKLIKFVFAGDVELEAFNQNKEIFNVKRILRDECQAYNMRCENMFNIRIAGKIENENIFVGTGELNDGMIKVKSLSEQTMDFSIGSEEFLYKYDRIRLKEGSEIQVFLESGSVTSLEINYSGDGILRQRII